MARAEPFSFARLGRKFVNNYNVRYLNELFILILIDMKRNYHLKFVSTFPHANRAEVCRCIPLGKRIKMAREQGIAPDGIVESVFDDTDFEGVDPLSDPRTDRFELIEKASDAQRAKEIAEANRVAAAKLSVESVTE